MSNLLELREGGGSSVEAVKLASGHLRGGIAGALQADAPFSEGDAQLLKFHGSYQQEDRDSRQARRATGDGKVYQFMVRARVPGGLLSPKQFLALDEIAAHYANATLRVTTRQGLQFHGVLKGDLQATIRRLDAALLTTFAACGDVNRNVMACPAPIGTAGHEDAKAVARRIAEHLTPRTQAYHEIWIEGERSAGLSAQTDVEPMYGATYLPRKFKIAVALPPDNCVDVLSNDVGLIADVIDDRLEGFTIVVGGGMGRTHGKPETFPRVATPLAFVEPHDVLDAVVAIVTLQRDYGDRENRRHARFKYLVEERGTRWTREEMERRFKGELQPPRPMRLEHVDDHLGWQRAADGTWFVGVFVENGRIADSDGARLRSCLRKLAGSHVSGVRFTAQQNVILTGIVERRLVETELRGHGVVVDPAMLGVRRDAMACPALPTCGLALTDAERALPAVMDRIGERMERLGLAESRVSIRMTGCPNGCARPYMGDIGLVGRSKGLYDIFVGGDAANTRLNWLFEPAVRLEQLPDAIAALLRAWRDDGANASLGDWCTQLGRDELLQRTQVLVG